MTNELATKPSAQQLDALGLLAFNGGNVKRTSEELGMPRQTLYAWRDRYVTEYGRIRDALLEQAESGIIGKLRENTSTAVEGLGRYLERITDQEFVDNDTQPATTAQRLAVIGGITSDKLRVWTDRPSVIHQHSPADVEESLNALRAKAIDLDPQDCTELPNP